MSDQVEFGDGDPPGLEGCEAGAFHRRVPLKSGLYSQTPSATNVVGDDNVGDSVIAHMCSAPAVPVRQYTTSGGKREFRDEGDEGQKLQRP